MSKTKKEIKLFNTWSFRDIKIMDITLENYINLKPIVPHSAKTINQWQENARALMKI